MFLTKHLRAPAQSRNFVIEPFVVAFHHIQQIKLRQYLVLEGKRHLQGQMASSIAAQMFLEVGLKPT